MFSVYISGIAHRTLCWKAGFVAVWALRLEDEEAEEVLSNGVEGTVLASMETKNRKKNKNIEVFAINT